MTSKKEIESYQLPEHVAENRRYWDSMAQEWVSAGENNWRTDVPSWGIWGLRESNLKLLPDDMQEMDAIELGCGTGYVSCWMARRGAAVTGIDNSAAQLKTANRLMEKHGMSLNLIHGDAEKVPFPDASFDFAISEYGAAIWCDPSKWIPEAWRILRPGGRLTFIGSHPLAIACTPENGDSCEAILHRPYFEVGKQDWRFVEKDPGGIEFNLPVSKWLQLFRETGFAVLDYKELRAPMDAAEDKFGVTADWAKNWPAEQVWKLQKVPCA